MYSISVLSTLVSDDSRDCLKVFLCLAIRVGYSDIVSFMAVVFWCKAFLQPPRRAICTVFPAVKRFFYLPCLGDMGQTHTSQRQNYQFEICHIEFQIYRLQIFISTLYIAVCYNFLK